MCLSKAVRNTSKSSRIGLTLRRSNLNQHGGRNLQYGIKEVLNCLYKQLRPLVHTQKYTEATELMV